MSAPDLSGANWRKSSFSGETGACIEIADGFPGMLPVRDSKDPQGASLLFTADAWTAFIAAVRAGDFPGEH